MGQNQKTVIFQSLSYVYQMDSILKNDNLNRPDRVWLDRSGGKQTDAGGKRCKLTLDHRNNHAIATLHTNGVTEMSITCTILPNGDLKLTADNETRRDIADALAQPSGNWWGVYCDEMESYSCNGSFTPFDAGDANPFVGLTSAPCIAESMCSDDSGENEIEGRFWYNADYMTRDELRELARFGRYVYTLATGE